MNEHEYRKQVEAEVAAAADPASGKDAGDAAALIETLRDNKAPAPDRLAAINRLKALEISNREVRERNAEITAALRIAATSGVAELNGEAIRELAVRKDSLGQRLLLDGLVQPDQAIVSPAKAIQLLALDDHNTAAPVVRQLVETSDDQDVVVQGLRLLASDKQSEPLFIRLLTDRDQSREVREQSAVGLNVLNPTKFRALGRRIIEDPSEDNALRAGALGTLTFDTEQRQIRENAKFRKGLTKLAAEIGSSAAIAAGRLLLRSKRERSE